MGSKRKDSLTDRHGGWNSYLDVSEGVLGIWKCGCQCIMNKNISWVPIYIGTYKKCEVSWVPNATLLKFVGTF